MWLIPLAWLSASPAVPDDVSAIQPLQPIYIENDKGEAKFLAEGYEFSRSIQAEVEKRDNAAGEMEEIEWTERVFIVRSASYRKAQLESLENRLQKAAEKLKALTPTPGRGKRQIQDETALKDAADVILKAYEVEDLLSFGFERQEKRQTKYLGRGRGTPDRPKQEILTIRYQITAVTRQSDTITEYQKTLGWRAFVSNAPVERLSLEQAVLTYRDEWIVERGFHRLTGTPLSLDPLFVKRDDQVQGMTNLLTIAVRFLTLIEFDVRRKLKRCGEKLTGLIENNSKKGIDNPTTERLLKQFDKIFLATVHLPGQVVRHVTHLNELQTRILELLGFSLDMYTCLTEN